jgi:hypothetical protein
MFESVRVISALKMAYVVFPTLSSAKTIFRVINESLTDLNLYRL